MDWLTHKKKLLNLLCIGYTDVTFIIQGKQSVRHENERSVIISN